MDSLSTLDRPDSEDARSDLARKGHSASRREMMNPKVLAALMGFGTAATAQAQIKPGGGVMGDPPPPSGILADPIYLLLQRTTFGFTEADYALATQMGFQGYLEWQLNFTSIDDTALATRLSAYTTLPMDAYQLFTLPTGSPSATTQLQDATLLRAVFSRRQLYERMVEFWSDHFSIDMNKVGILKVVDDREVIRPYALTTFFQLLNASAHSPGMLVYLDNQTSTATTPNQNYPRELLELHTMGVDNGYTQTDVSEVAKCLSGWGLYGSSAGKNYGKFLFTASRHNNGAKTVLGTQIAAGGGIRDGETVIRILASHPNTARFVATKLVRRFLSDDPPAHIIDEVADVFLATGGEIAPMLRVILTPRNLLTYAQPRYKRPFHLIASMLRASSATITNISSSRNLLTGMGHLPFRWAPPNGYPDFLEYWVGLILPRWNFAFSLMNNNISGATVNAASIFAGMTSNAVIANRINQMLANSTMDLLDVTTVQNYMSPTETDINKIREALALGMASPSFQWY